MSKPRVTERDREIAEAVSRMDFKPSIAITVAAYREEVTGELVAAGKAMLGMDNPAAPDVGHVDYRRAVQMMRAAIAKAEGRE